MSAILSNLNKELHLVPFVSVKTLEVGKKFEIQGFSEIDTKYGEKIVVQCTEFQAILPNRFTEKFTQELIKNINQEISIGKKSIWLVEEQ